MLHRTDWDREGHVHTTVAEARECQFAPDPLYDAPTCSICDGVGHGYPGGGPCPLEEQGWAAARWDEEREALMLV